MFINRRRSAIVFSLLAYIFIFFPYLNILPGLLPFETAPFAGFFSLLYIGITFTIYTMHTGKLPAIYLFLIVFTFLLAPLYYRYEFADIAGYQAFYNKTAFSLLLGIAVFTFAALTEEKINKTFVSLVLLFWIGSGLIQISPFVRVFNKFLQVINTRSVGSVNSRGIQLLANEPSYAGIILVFFLLLINFPDIRRNYRRIHRLFFTVCIGLMIILTRSASALVYLLFLVMIIILFNIFPIRVKKILVVILLSAGIYCGYQTIPHSPRHMETRSMKLLILLKNNPSRIFVDHSISSRLQYLIMSYYGLIDSKGLGHGIGSYSFRWRYIAQKLDILKKFPHAWNITRDYSAKASLMPMSFYGGIAHDMGVFGLLFFLGLTFSPAWFMIKKKELFSSYEKKYIFISTAMVFFTWLQACSFAMPYPWLMLGLNYSFYRRRGIEL